MSSDKIVITAAEMVEIERVAARLPTKDGLITPRIIKALIKLVADTYGIDLGIETEDMHNERAKREEKRLGKKRTFRLGGNVEGLESDGDNDDF